MDEPTSGLSLYDTARLITLVEELISRGNSVIVVEHDPDFLRCATGLSSLDQVVVAQGEPGLSRRGHLRSSHKSSIYHGEISMRSIESVSCRREKSRWRGHPSPWGNRFRVVFPWQWTSDAHHVASVTKSVVSAWWGSPSTPAISRVLTNVCWIPFRSNTPNPRTYQAFRYHTPAADHDCAFPVLVA